MISAISAGYKFTIWQPPSAGQIKQKFADLPYSPLQSETMAKLEELDDSAAKTHKKRNHGSTRFFVFVDYLFLLIFVAFLAFIIFKMVGM
ncbi:hypothetical protein L6164_018740 [Bauhinia variegata]|uniref:Uncharacterized protein n=1 Tax=Bauhinia variegata TaxID=167791 RepID=A0ACB9NCV7_BAUVA|nr:hypothetical protein L6164_018740 [Bauhinia variegata]